MNKKLFVTGIVILFLGVALAPSIHAKIQQETIDEIPTIIEENEFIRNYIEKNFDEDCDCEEQETTAWSFPIICGLLYPLAILSWVMFYIPMLIFGPNWPGIIGAFFYMTMKNIGTTLNCNWADM